MSLRRFFSVRHSDCVISHQEKSKVNFLMMDGAGTEDKPLKIPKEVWILVNHLFTKSCDQVRRPQLIKHSLQQKDVYHWQVWQWTWGMKLIDVVVLILRNVLKKNGLSCNREVGNTDKIAFFFFTNDKHNMLFEGIFPYCIAHSITRNSSNVLWGHDFMCITGQETKFLFAM